MVTYKVKTTIPAITSKESEVIAFHSIFFCQGVGYKISEKHDFDIRRLQRKSASRVGGPPPVNPGRDRRERRFRRENAWIARFSERNRDAPGLRRSVPQFHRLPVFKRIQG